MIRLWSRVGTFRALSVAVLLAGVTGAGLVADRQTHPRSTASNTQVAADVAPEQPVDPTADQADAQRKADEAATVAAAQAQAAEDEARKSQPASRSTPRPSATPTPTGKPGAPVGPIPTSCQQYTANRAIGCTLMLEAGFGLDQFPCLERLWTKESGWNERAYNKSSDAGGIPQAKPMSKMSKYGADYRTNPATQIRWGLDYVKGKYKTPCGAWSTFQAKGWY